MELWTCFSRRLLGRIEEEEFRRKTPTNDSTSRFAVFKSLLSTRESNGSFFFDSLAAPPDDSRPETLWLLAAEVNHGDPGQRDDGGG